LCSSFRFLPSFFSSLSSILDLPIQGSDCEHDECHPPSVEETQDHTENQAEGRRRKKTGRRREERTI
jgi:hypothetical protein